MITDDMKNGIVQLRAYLPAQDFAVSHAFYEALGFEPHSLGPQLTDFQLGTFAFLLQDFYEQRFAENLMMHLMVENLDAWWSHINALKLDERFPVPPPTAPKVEPWGLRICYVYDPSGVLWHVAAETDKPKVP
jgi:catechol 2,3-dioxygenase-like lactoylglutathione lyase family enzyme